jgi:predicted nucleic acid-binding protein
LGQLSSAIESKVVAVDSAPIIYYLEEHPEYSAAADELFGAIRQRHASGLTSIITLLEVLVLPLRRGRKDLAEQYRRLLLHTRAVTVVNIDGPICELAAQLRANYPWLRTPDAIQVATATAHRADVIVTNDERWKRLTEIPVMVLKDYVNRRA